VPRQYYPDITFTENYTFNWHNITFQFYHIPGHSQGSSLIVMNGQYAFTGDSLLKDLPIIIRFPGSNRADYESITMPLLSNLLTSDMTVLPGHGDPFVLKEIMENNQIYVQFR
jgi:Zn-dependent hydrolases, including glyoxylases